MSPAGPALGWEVSETEPRQSVRQRTVTSGLGPRHQRSGRAFGQEPAEPGVTLTGRGARPSQYGDVAAVALVEAVDHPQLKARVGVGSSFQDLLLLVVVDLWVLVARAAAAPAAQQHDHLGAVHWWSGSPLTRWSA